MLSLIIKLFIKDSENVEDSKVRTSYGVVLGGYGIFLNILLFIGKYIGGILSASIAMRADAFNNLSDAGSSIVQIIGFKLSSKEPDPGHPFGHGRLEYISGLIVSFMIVLMGYELLTSSIDKIIHPEEIVKSYISLGILVVSLLVKFYMSLYSKKYGKKIDSPAIMAVATDSLSDMVSTTVVLITTIIGITIGLRIDGICGLLIGILIIVAGINAAKDTISPLLGNPPSREFVDAIEKIVMCDPKIVGMHDLIVHDYGPGRVILSLHAEVPSDGDICELHDLIDNVEYELGKQLNCVATIHMDPVAVGDPLIDKIKGDVKTVLNDMEGIRGLHDFRLVAGPTHVNIIFDVVASYSLKKTDQEIIDEICAKIKEKCGNYFCKITVDRDYAENEKE